MCENKFIIISTVDYQQLLFPTLFYTVYNLE